MVGAYLHGQSVTEKGKGPGQLLKRGVWQANGPPLGAAYLHLPAVFFQGNGAEQIAVIAKDKQVGCSGWALDARLQLIGEDEEGGVAAAEEPQSAIQTVDVVLGGPVFSDVALFAGHAAGELS